MSHRAIRAAVHGAERTIGRARLARLARLVTNEVRLDAGNAIERNGEQTVQRVALTEPDPIVLDVGAHFGEWSHFLLAQEGHRPTIHAFEPSAISATKARAALLDRATVHQFALSDTPGQADLHIVHEGAGSNSLVAFTDEQRASGETETVEVATLDDTIVDLGLDRITLLKIDAEGHDLSVIRGGGGMLKRQVIGLVQFEYNLRWIDSRAFLLDAFEELQPHGYSLGKVTPRGVEVYPNWHHELETFTEGNYLAWLPRWDDRIPKIPWWGG